MILYTVKYKRFFIWHKLKNIKADGLIDNHNYRFFINDKDERIEIPMNCIFIFSKERNLTDPKK